MESSRNHYKKTMTSLTRSETRVESSNVESKERVESQMVSNIVSNNANNCEEVMTRSTQLIELECLRSGDHQKYSVMDVMDITDVSDVVNTSRFGRSYNPSLESRQLHNQKERLRRLRIKCSCDALRQLVPGISDKTDKATVLEHSVNFLVHLSNCSRVKCDDYFPQIPPPISAKLMEMYPKLTSDNYHFYETIPTEDEELKQLEPQFNEYEKQELCPNTCDVRDLSQSNGTQFVTTSDGFQYMIIESTQQSQQSQQTQHTIQYNEHIDESVVNSKDTNVQDLQLISLEVSQVMAQEMPNNCCDNQFSQYVLMSSDERPIDCSSDHIKCFQQVVDVFTEQKENIDPKFKKELKKVLKKQKRKRLPKNVGIKRKCAEEELAKNESNNDVVIHSISSKTKKRNQKKALKPKLNK